MAEASNSQVWLTVPEVANKLGLSKMTVYRMVAQKELRAYQFGRTYRVKQEDLGAYIERSQV